MIKMSDNKNVNVQGGWFLPVLALIFITLKLTEVIDWDWLWVLAPLWIPLAIFVIVGIIVFIVMMFKKL